MRQGLGSPPTGVQTPLSGLSRVSVVTEDVVNFRSEERVG